ncbi:hypothetical protein DFQ27_001293, partial [Actinomortierella ambigua]
TIITSAMRFNTISCLSIVAALLSPSMVQAETAYGQVRTIAGGIRFTSSFYINGLQYRFDGNLSPAVPDLSSRKATLKYESTEQLFATRVFSGTIGIEDFELTLVNGPVISGRLDVPVDRKSSVAGAGRWDISYVAPHFRLQGCQDLY